MAVAKDIQRAVNKAMAILPQAVTHAAAVTLEAAVLTQQLDEALCINLPTSNAPLTVADYTTAYLTCCTPEQLQRQLTIIAEASLLMDRYVHRRLLLSIFRIML